VLHGCRPAARRRQAAGPAWVQGIGERAELHCGPGVGQGAGRRGERPRTGGG
jgi:hypothetical protein